MKASNDCFWDDSQCVVSDDYNEPLPKNSVYKWQNNDNVLVADKGHARPTTNMCDKDNSEDSMMIPKIKDDGEIAILHPTPRLGSLVEKIKHKNREQRLNEFKKLKNCSSWNYSHIRNKSNGERFSSWKYKCRVDQKLSSHRILNSINGGSQTLLSNIKK
ncbi:unnamed protein product [Moneuplotes crassus]|uniref:Uncharacterized protein n=1 Tax=Euplotes crassus TaxID=5936 RepID=A0AAD1UC55_EUPCR|nr:unnamed protein product [Moneuplotes crassus]